MMNAGFLPRLAPQIRHAPVRELLARESFRARIPSRKYSRGNPFPRIRPRDNLARMSRYQAGENLPYFCTITILDWTPVFIEARYIDPLIESLSFSRANKGLQLFAYVVMPNHVHLNCSDSGVGARRDSRTGEGEDSRTSEAADDLHAMMRDFKRFTSRTIQERLVADGRGTVLGWLERAAQRARRQRGEFSYWQDGPQVHDGVPRLRHIRRDRFGRWLHAFHDPACA